MVPSLSNQDLEEAVDPMHNIIKGSSSRLQVQEESIDDETEKRNIKESRISKSAYALLLFALLSAAVLGATMVGVNHRDHHNLHQPDPAYSEVIVTPTSNVFRHRRLQEALGTCPFQLKSNYAVPAIPAAAAATGASGGALCTGPPTMFSMFFRSKSCAQGAVGVQSIMNYQCQDFNGGTSTIPQGQKVYIAAIGNNGRLLYSGSHLDGTDFYIWNLFNPLPNTTVLEISSDTNRTHLLQRVTFPSSCDVAGGDVLSNTFGSVQITGFTTEEQGTVNVAPSAPAPAVQVPPIKATFTLSLAPTANAAAAYTLTKWQFQTNYTQPPVFLIPMEGANLDATGVQTTLEVASVNLARLPQTLQTTMIVTATSTSTLNGTGTTQVCEVYLTDVYTISSANAAVP